ncbi:MAG: GMP synthase (glutamine-hydrolyzing) [Planctomycetota bacterium]|jgi:GMP synthase (glutamine-hydrolysing)
MVCSGNGLTVHELFVSRILLLQVGSTVPGLQARRGDFDLWFKEGLGAIDVDVLCPHLGDALPQSSDYGGVVITGASCMVTDDEPWSLAVESWLKTAVHDGVAIYGVCYGHQLLARALGGEVGWNSNGREIGSVEVKLTEDAAADAMFAGLPAPLLVHESHSQSVLVLPPGARRLAFNRHDDNQAFAYGKRAWGTQFHPEFDAEIVSSYIDERRVEIESEGLDPNGLLLTARESDVGRVLLRRFAAIVQAS